MFGPVPHVSDEQIKQMAHEAERENLLLPRAERVRRGTYYRRAAIRLGIVPLPDLSVDELAFVFVVAMSRARG